MRPLHLILLAIAALATLVPALLVAYGPVVRSSPRYHPGAMPAKRVVAPTEVPPVEPMAFVQLPADEARAFNATVPFVAGPIPAARPFRFAGSIDDRARATDCLATALIYEAGDDAVGEQAVAQVILNRVRHPAYPKTVCGVVFQGSERSTGCQFTFTCDGALGRWSPTAVGWARAQRIAAAALNGQVMRSVGWATHYHTNWVVPYWQSSLDKIASVGTHLFFRWTGWWGTAGAFRDPGAQAEPAIAKLGALSEVHRTAAGLTDEDIAAALGLPMALENGQMAMVAEPEPGALVAPDENDAFLATLPRDLSADAFPALAARACGERPYCKFLAWTPLAGVPAALPLTARQQASMGFSYLRDRARGFDKPLWNCAQFRRADATQCMRVQPPIGEVPAPAAVPTPAVPELTGVRRRGPAPVPMPSPLATGSFMPPGTSPAAAPLPNPPRLRSDDAATRFEAEGVRRKTER